MVSIAFSAIVLRTRHSSRDRAQHGHDLGHGGGTAKLLALPVQIAPRPPSRSGRARPRRHRAAPAAAALAQDLPHQLRADRAAGARHQHGLVLDVARQQCRIGRHRIAAQADPSTSTGRKSLTVTRPDAKSSIAGSVLTLTLSEFELAQGRLSLAPVRARQRQQHLPHVMALHHPGQTLGAENLEAGHILAPNRRARVHETDQRVAPRIAQGLDKLDAGSSRAVDHHVARASRRPLGQLDAGMSQQPPRHPTHAPDASRWWWRIG